MAQLLSSSITYRIGVGPRGSTPEARTAMPVHPWAGHLGKAPVAHAQRQRRLPAEDGVARRHDARHLRATGCHRAAGGLGGETAGQPDALPRRIRAQQQISRAGDTVEAGQGRSACHDSGTTGAHASRTPRRDDLGTAPEAVVGDRHRDRRGLARGAMRSIACIEDADVIEKILAHLDEKGADCEATRRAPSRAPPHRGLFDATA